jgi:cysteine desulfurase
MEVESKKLSDLRDLFESNLFSNIDAIRKNGDASNRLPNNSSLTFQGIDAEALIMSMPDIALSTGSACNSGAQEPSYVLKAIGLSHEEANSTLRIGLGRFNTRDEIIDASKNIIKAVNNFKSK